jgi:hypothetical protein
MKAQAMLPKIKASLIKYLTSLPKEIPRMKYKRKNTKYMETWSGLYLWPTKTQQHKTANLAPCLKISCKRLSQNI